MAVENPWTWLATVDASLNALTTVLLLVGRQQAKAGKIEAHKRTMLAALATSALFLACYLVYHAKVGSVPFRGEGAIRTFYLGLLLTHVVLAALIPFLALRVAFLGLRRRDAEHAWLARITWPLWIYVSVTGVVVYAMVYHY